MKCRKCGAQITDESKFCPYCGSSQRKEEANQLGPETNDTKKAEDVESSNAQGSSANAEVIENHGSQGDSSNKQTAKEVGLFLAKGLGLYAGVLAVIFVAAVAAGVICGVVSLPYYRLAALFVIALICTVPYVIVVAVLVIAGKTRRARARSAIKKVKDRNPLAFKAIIAVSAVALLVMLFTFTSCPHSEWISATCTEPKKCSTCGKTEGDPLGHDWSEATCTTPKTCSRCGTTDGEPLGHDLGEWKHVVDYVNASSEDIQKCKRCGETVETKNGADVTSFVGDGKFIIPAQDFCKRLESKITSYSGYGSLSVDLDLSSSGTGADLKIKKNSRTVGLGGFYSDSSTQILYAMTQSENAYFNVVIYLGSDSSSYLAVTLVSLIETADPTLSTDEAKEIAKACIEEPVEKNGVTYAAAQSGGYWLSARIE